MKYPSLKNLLEQLKLSPRVKGIFSTGTTATGLTPWSDIDLVIVLDKNDEKIKLVYSKIENRIADIFFFDVDFVLQLKGRSEVPGNAFAGMFLTWLAQGKIEYDPENLLSDLETSSDIVSPTQNVEDQEKRELWIKINYNYLVNSRYFKATKEIYHQALELRLLYSVIELITAYFSFRNIPWRGEKTAVQYLEQNDLKFLSTFEAYTKSTLLVEKMKYYSELFNHVFFKEYQKWGDDFIVPISQQNLYDWKAVDFLDKLINNH